MGYLADLTEPIIVLKETTTVLGKEMLKCSAELLRGKKIKSAEGQKSCGLAFFCQGHGHGGLSFPLHISLVLLSLSY